MSSAPAKPFTGFHMLMVFVAFFAVVIGVNGFMAYTSARTWTGLVVQNSYVEGQAFEANKKLIAEQKALGWKLGLTNDQSRFRFSLTDKDGAPLKVGAVSLTLQRPVGGHDDRTVSMTAEPDGAFSADIPVPAGSWDAIVQIDETPHGRVEYQRRLLVR